MNNLLTHKTRTIWFLFPILLSLGIIVIILYVQIPPFLSTLNQGKTVFSLLRGKNLKEELPKQIDEVKSNISKLHVIAQSLDSLQKNSYPLTDLLYSYANDAAFTLKKVETSTPLKIDNHYETSITLNGSGTYESIGKFTEKIENSSQPVKIRQQILTTNDNGNIDILMEMAVFSE